MPETQEETMGAQKGWTIKEVKAYTATCDECGFDLLTDGEYACWVQPEGVEESLAELTWCPECNAPLTEAAKESAADA